MSDETAVVPVADPRRLVPVGWDVERPERVSVTLAKHADNCPRSAALYLKYRGGGSSGPLLRGSLFHAFAERAMLQLMMHGERSFVEPAHVQDIRGGIQSEGAREAKQSITSLSKQWVDELVEELGLPVCTADVDDVREMAYHWMIGQDVNPGDVLAVERKFVLETGAGLLSGKVDLAALPSDGTLQVDDYKSSFYVPPQDDYERLIQAPLYAAMILFGNPVEKRKCKRCAGSGRGQDMVRLCSRCGERDPMWSGLESKGWETVDGEPVCSDCLWMASGREGDPPVDDVTALKRMIGPVVPVACTACKGRGTVEEILPNMGLEAEWVRARQVYPRFLREDGTLAYREKVLGRADLRDVVLDAARILRRVWHGVETREWPAVSGAHCTECPAVAECPLPETLRRFAGTINTPAQASEAMVWAERQGDLVRATRAEVVAYVKADETLEGRLPVDGETFALQVSNSRALKRSKGRSDWEGLEGAVIAAAEEGAPFDVNDWLKQQTKTEFKRLKGEG